MAGKVWDKVTSVFFQEEDEDALKPEEMNQMAQSAEKDVWQENDPKRARRNQIMAIPGGAAATTASKAACEMVLTRVHSYDDLEEMATNVKNHKAVLANMEELDAMTAMRMVDYLAGAVFAMDGRCEKVSGATYLFSPSQVDLAGQIMENEVESLMAQETTPVWRR